MTLINLIKQIPQAIRQRKVPEMPHIHGLKIEIKSALTLLMIAEACLAFNLKPGEWSSFVAGSGSVLTEANASTDAAADQPNTVKVNFNPVLDKTLDTSNLRLAANTRPGKTKALAAAVQSNQEKAPLSAANDTVQAKDKAQDTAEVMLASIETPAVAQISKEKTVVNKQMNAVQKSNADYQQATVYLQQGRVAEAQESLKKALENNPGFDDALQTLVSLLVDNGRNDEAMSILNAGMVAASDKTGFAETLARLQLDAGLTEEALTTLENNLAYANNNPTYQVLLAAVLQKSGRHKDAVTHYQQALASGNTSPACLVGLALSLLADGQNQAAKQVFLQAQQNQLSAELALFVAQQLKQIQ